jgi:putative membrane protein insertion efficiency factor
MKNRVSHRRTGQRMLAPSLPPSTSWQLFSVSNDLDSNDLTTLASHDGRDEISEEQKEEVGDESTTVVLISMIQWYKDMISPFMGPNCRFYPTCSSYGIESLREHGPVKGLVLTAWRIMRCNPFGGKGYDPPQWPPPGWFAGSS